MDRQDYDFDNTAKVDKWLLRGLVAIVFVMVGGCIVKEAAAHHVPDSDGIMYDPGCCNSAATHPTGDCAPIDDMYVTERADGYHISIPRGGAPQTRGSRLFGHRSLWGSVNPQSAGQSVPRLFGAERHSPVLLPSKAGDELMTVHLVPLAEFSKYHANGWRMVPGYPLEPGDYAVTMASPGHKPIGSNAKRGSKSAGYTRMRKAAEAAEATA